MRSPFQMDIMLLIDFLRAEDDLVALQDSVIVMVENNIFINKLLSISVNMYAIKQDIYARGIQGIVSNEVNIIDYVQFVYLTNKNKTQMSW